MDYVVGPVWVCGRRGCLTDLDVDFVGEPPSNCESRSPDLYLDGSLKWGGVYYLDLSAGAEAHVTDPLAGGATTFRECDLA